MGIHTTDFGVTWDLFVKEYRLRKNRQNFGDDVPKQANSSENVHRLTKNALFFGDVTNYIAEPGTDQYDLFPV